MPIKAKARARRNAHNFPNVIAFPSPLRTSPHAYHGATAAEPAPEQTFAVSMAGYAAAKVFKSETPTQDQLRVEIADRLYRNDKDGPCIVGASLLDGKRNKESVAEVSIVIFDVDGAQSVDEVKAIMENAGVYSLGYTTHSHMAERTDVVVDHYERWAKKEKQPVTPTLESMQAYVAAKGKAHLSNIQFDPNNDYERVPDLGNVYKLRHDPVHKVRLLFPLATPIKISALAASNTKALERYKSIYCGIGDKLGLKYDEACTDPCRLHYLPSCPKAMAEHAQEFEAIGPLLDWTDETEWPRAVVDCPVKDVGGSASPDSGKSAKPPLVFEGRNIRNWAPNRDQYGVAFDVEGLVESCMPDSIAGPRNGGGHVIRCPFEDEHTKPGGQGTWCANEYATSQGTKWTISCSHDSCQGRAPIDYIHAWLTQGAFTVEQLEEHSEHKFGQASKRVASSESAEGNWRLPSSGAFVVPYGHMESALRQMNEAWAVVPIGSKTRYARIRHDGQTEFFDKTNFQNLFEACKYQAPVESDHTGKPVRFDLEPFLPVWLHWEHRRQYAGYGFFPGGDPPPGHFNIWKGFNVEPKQGDWSLLRTHVFENVCQGKQEYFDWLMAWLAQMFQHPEIKPGTHLVLIGDEGVGKSKLGEWIIKALKPCAMTLTAGERLVGRFNGHFEALLFAMAEEVFWAGDPRAEGVIKALATANEMDYERKGLDAEPGLNFTRLMIASNNPWVVPAWSGGRRWFVLEVGAARKEDRDYFAAIDEQMKNGGLAAMLYDLLQHTSDINVRKVPVTPWLIEQRQYSADTKRVWLRDVIERGMFTNGYAEGSTDLSETESSALLRGDVFESAKPFFERKGYPATEGAVCLWLKKELGDLFDTKGPRLTHTKNGKTSRPRSWVFAPLPKLREHWRAKYGEALAVPDDNGDD